MPTLGLVTAMDYLTDVKVVVGGPCQENVWVTT